MKVYFFLLLLTNFGTFEYFMFMFMVDLTELDIFVTLLTFYQKQFLDFLFSSHCFSMTMGLKSK